MLESILKVGKAVEIEIQRPDTEPLILRSAVERSYDGQSLNIVAPIHKGRVYPISIGLSFSLIYVDNRRSDRIKVMRLPVIVKDRRIVDNIPILQLVPSSDAEELQRRESFRLPIMRTLAYYHNDNFGEILTRDLSAGGVRGVINERFEVNDELIVDLDLDEEVIELRAVVVSCELMDGYFNKFDVRMSFKDVTNAQQSQLINYLFGKQAESIRKKMDLDLGSSNYISEHIKIENKRVGADKRVRIVQYLGLSSALMMLLIIFMITQAKPEFRNGLDMFWGYQRRETWDIFTLNISMISAIVLTLVTSFGLYLNSTRMKRRDDRWNISLILGFVFSVMTLVFYLFVAL